MIDSRISAAPSMSRGIGKAAVTPVTTVTRRMEPLP
jgi:hypothetical protein